MLTAANPFFLGPLSEPRTNSVEYFKVRPLVDPFHVWDARKTSDPAHTWHRTVNT